jgi:hypothetical protein
MTPVPMPAPLPRQIEPHFFDLDHLDLEAITHNAREIAESMKDVHLFAQGVQPPQPAPQAPLPPMAIPPFRYSGNDSGENLYERGRNFMDNNQYDRAVSAFDQLIGMRTNKTEAAMYWKAYSLNKTARRTDALATLSEMQKQFAKGPWADDARRLDVLIRQSSGQPVSPDSIDDEDLKLLVLQGVMQSDPEAALAPIEKILAGNGSVRLKERALFLIASRSRSPRGRQIITAAAKGSSNPDLQMSAIQSLGRMGGPESIQALEEIYRASSDQDVKRRILQALAQANAADRLGPIARTEKDPELKLLAIRQLGASRQVDSSETLSAIYTGDSSMEVRKAVIDALASNSRNMNSVKALIALSRNERNKDLQSMIVQRLANIKNSPEATAYMLEILSK